MSETEPGAVAAGQQSMTPPLGLVPNAVAAPRQAVPTLAEVPPDCDGEQVLAALGLPVPPVAVLVLGAADSLPAAVATAAGRLLEGAVRFAADRGGLLVDGATDSGVMAALGRARARVGPGAPPLLGVAPAGRVSPPGRAPDAGEVALEPSHSHVALVDCDRWGSETPVLLAVGDAVARGGSVAAVVVGGGAITREEVAAVAARGWPVVAVSGSGGAADELSRPDAGGWRTIGDTPLMSVALDAAPAALTARLEQAVAPDPALAFAWRSFATLDTNASRHQRAFRRLQLAVLVLGVVTTTLVVIHASLERAGLVSGTALGEALRQVIVLLPITVTALVAASGRFRPGAKWVTMRGAAESIKAESYRYRTRVEPYAAAAPAAEGTETSPPTGALVDAVGQLLGAVMRTDVNIGRVDRYQGPLPPAGLLAPGDDGVSPMSGDDYVRLRLADQLDYYQRAADRHFRKMRRLRGGMIIAGAAGTYLAAVGLELWVAVTGAIGAAFVTHLEYEQTENSLLHYRQAATDLELIRAWWQALPSTERAAPNAVERVVEQGERVMRAEQSGWVQEMQDAMLRLRTATRQAATDASRER